MQLHLPDPSAITIDAINLPAFGRKNIHAAMLRLDKIHPVISGNKWFKLKYYLQEACEKNASMLVSFGGAYSNHIVALACAAQQAGIASVGIIRGERASSISPTLKAAESYGMKLHFISRGSFKQKDSISFFNDIKQQFPGCLIIPEGGSGPQGIKGCMEILSVARSSQYSHILCALGTGTMFAGLANSSASHQQLIGISVLKGMADLSPEQKALINENKLSSCSIIDNYHFGGYAKKTGELIDFMNRFYRETAIPTDFVYAGKLFYAMHDLVKKDYFPDGSRILIIHSGGLQGNASLAAGSLVF